MKKTITNFNRVKKHLANIDNKNACKEDMKRIKEDVEYCDKMFELFMKELNEKDVNIEEVLEQIKEQASNTHDELELVMCEWILGRLEYERTK